MVIALPRDNPLATQPTLALEQLRDVAPILFPREVAPGCMSWCTTAVCAPGSIWSAPGSRRKFRRR